MSLVTRPEEVLQHDPTANRPLIAGPDTPGPPFPIYLSGPVQRGFGRGSKDLGCPTANLPDEAIAPYASSLTSGVYYGYSKVFYGYAENDAVADEHERVWPMVMSIGWNPYYKNKRRTAEVHVLHDFSHDFYGKELRTVILGFIRPEFNYTSLDALIDDINTDKTVANQSVSRPAYEAFVLDCFFMSSTPAVHGTQQERASDNATEKLKFVKAPAMKEHCCEIDQD